MQKDDLAATIRLHEKLAAQATTDEARAGHEAAAECFRRALTAEPTDVRHLIHKANRHVIGIG